MNKVQTCIQTAGKERFPKKARMIHIYLPKLTFYRKPRWSVQSMWTSLKRYLSK